MDWPVMAFPLHRMLHAVYKGLKFKQICCKDSVHYLTLLLGVSCRSRGLFADDLREVND